MYILYVSMLHMRCIYLQVARLAVHDPICLKAPAPGINAPAAFHEATAPGGGGDVGNTVDGFQKSGVYQLIW